MAVIKYSSYKQGNNILTTKSGVKTHFKVCDFRDPNYDEVLISEELVDLLYNLELALQKCYNLENTPRLSIHSGYRNPNTDIELAGYAGKHSMGLAADVNWVSSDGDRAEPEMGPRICCTLERMGHQGGIGYIEDKTYSNIHIDVRTTGKYYFDEVPRSANGGNGMNYEIGSWFNYLPKVLNGKRTNYGITYTFNEKYYKLDAIGNQNPENLPTEPTQSTRERFFVQWDKNDPTLLNPTAASRTNDRKHYGIDISYCQDGMDVYKVLKTNPQIEFVIFQIGQYHESGYWSQDELYDHGGIEQCVKAGIPFGIYVYSYVSSEDGMKRLVSKTKEIINQIKLKEVVKDNGEKVKAIDYFAFPVSLDIEADNPLYKMAKKGYYSYFTNINNLNQIFIRGDDKDGASGWPLRYTAAENDGVEVRFLPSIYCFADGFGCFRAYLNGNEKNFYHENSVNFCSSGVGEPNSYIKPHFGFELEYGVYQFSDQQYLKSWSNNVDGDYAWYDLKKNSVLVTSNGTVIKNNSKEVKSKKQIYEEIQRADYIPDGTITKEDAQLILKKSAKLIPSEETVFKNFNRLMVKSIAVPPTINNIKDSFSSYNKTLDAVVGMEAGKMISSWFGVEEPQTEEKYTDILNDLDNQLNSIIKSGDLNRDGKVDNKDAEIAIEIAMGLKTYDPIMKIFPNASLLMNCFAIYCHAQNKMIGEYKEFIDWQNNIFKPKLFENIGIKLLKECILNQIMIDPTVSDYSSVWKNFILQIQQQYDKLGLTYTTNGDGRVEIDILKYFINKTDLVSIQDVCSILSHIFGIKMLDKKTMIKLNYNDDNEINLADAYMAYLFLIIIIQAMPGEFNEGSNKGESSEQSKWDKYKEILSDPINSWYYPTVDDIFNGRPNNPFVAFRDITRYFVIDSPDLETSKQIYKSFFGEDWSQKFFGTVNCKINTGTEITFNYLFNNETNDVEFFYPTKTYSSSNPINNIIPEYFQYFTNGEEGEGENKIQFYTVKRKTLFVKMLPNNYTKEIDENGYKVFKLDNDWYMFNYDGFYEVSNELIPINHYEKAYEYQKNVTFYYLDTNGYQTASISNINDFKNYNGNLYIYTGIPNGWSSEGNNSEEVKNKIIYEKIDALPTMRTSENWNNEPFQLNYANNEYYPYKYSVKDGATPNITIGHFSSVPKNYFRTIYLFELKKIMTGIKKLTQTVKDKIEAIQVNGSDNKTSQELIDGDEVSMIEHFFNVNLRDKNDKPLYNQFSTLFNNISYDDANAVYYYDFYREQNNHLEKLGSYCPLDIGPQQFYFKYGNDYKDLNGTDSFFIDIKKGIEIKENHTLSDILHENLMVFNKIMDWDFWKEPIDMSKITDLSEIEKTNGRIGEEWVPHKQNQKFFHNEGDGNLGFTITKEGDLEIVDHNQAIFFLKMLSLMYPGIMKYRKDDFNYNTGWVKGLTENPEKLVFWIDFLDDVGEISKYSVKNIGQRQKVVTQDNVRAIKYLDTEKTVFIEPGLPTKENTKQAKFAATHQGYSYFQLGRRFMEQLALSGQGIDAYTVIENMLYNYTQCAESVTMSTIPLYFLEPNSRLQVYNPDTDVNSTYVLSKLSIPLGHSGTMSLTMTKALEDNVVRGEITKV